MQGFLLQFSPEFICVFQLQISEMGKAVFITEANQS